MKTKYAYKITRTAAIFDESESAELKAICRGAGLTDDDKKTFKAGKIVDGLQNHSFSVYDDDDEFYFGGMIQTNIGGEELFSPLDNVGAAYGCTSIKIDGEYL